MIRAVHTEKLWAEARDFVKEEYAKEAVPITKGMRSLDGRRMKLSKLWKTGEKQKGTAVESEV